jgi:hypothetical protein
MMNGITIFGEISFVLSFVSYGLVIKLLEAWCAFEKWRRKQNVKRSM